MRSCAALAAPAPTAAMAPVAAARRGKAAPGAARPSSKPAQRRTWTRRKWVLRSKIHTSEARVDEFSPPAPTSGTTAAPKMKKGRCGGDCVRCQGAGGDDANVTVASTTVEGEKTEAKADGTKSSAAKAKEAPASVKKAKKSGNNWVKSTYGPTKDEEPYPLWLMFFPFASNNWNKGTPVKGGWFLRALAQNARVPSAYPEWGNDGAIDMITSSDPKVAKKAARELMHGRWAMLGVTGAIAAENTTGVPWFEAGAACDFDITTPCTITYGGYDIDTVPYAAWGLLFVEILLMTGVEVHRTGWPAFDETPPSAFEDCTQNDMYPGGRFDPLNVGVAPGGNTNDEYLRLMQVRELKHGRLAMLAWLGMIVQALTTHEGPMANLATHRANPGSTTLVTNLIEPLLAASDAQLDKQAAEKIAAGVPTYADNAAAFLQAIGNQ